MMKESKYLGMSALAAGSSVGVLLPVQYDSSAFTSAAAKEGYIKVLSDGIARSSVVRSPPATRALRDRFLRCNQRGTRNLLLYFYREIHP